MECHRELGCSEEELREMLSRHLDGELSGPEAEAVEDHLKECDRCRAEVASLRGVDRTVRRSVDRTRASKNFVRRVMHAMSGRHGSVGGGSGRRAVVWGISALLAVGAGSLVWVVVSWLVASAPEPLRELGLALPGSVPGLEAARPPHWRTRRSGTRKWTALDPGSRVAAGTELELLPAGGPGLVERADGLRVYCAAGARLVVGPAATDEGGLILAEGRVFVALSENARRFELGLFDPSDLKRTEPLPGPAAAFEGEAASVLFEVHDDVAVVTTVSGKVSLSWATGARDLVARERAEVTDAEGAGGVTLVDLRALDLGFAPARLSVSPWPQVGGSAARQGCSPFEFALPPKRILDLGAGSGAAGPVIGLDGTAYVLVGAAPGRLLGVRGGKVAASVALDEAPVGAPAVAPDGTVFVVTQSGVVRAPADLARVERIVALAPGDMPRAGPTVAPGGDLYIVLGAGLAAFAPDGRPLWRRNDIRSGSPPSVGPDGTVYVAAISGKLHALDPVTGEDRAPASTPMDEPFLAHVAVAPDGTAYAVSARRYLAWRTPEGRSGRVRLPVSEYVLAPAITPSGEVVVVSSGGIIHRLGPRPSEAPARPFFQVGEGITRGPLVDASGRVVVWTASGRLVAVEPSGRSMSWELGAEEGSAGAVTRGGAILFVTRGGVFFGR